MKFSPSPGKIFLVSFQFENLPRVSKRPALAISDPDIDGYVEFVFLSTHEETRQGVTVELPFGLLSNDHGKIVCDKKYLLPANVIVEELSAISHELLDEVLKQVIKASVGRYFQTIHQPAQNRPFIPGTSRINYGGRVFDEEEMQNLVESALDFWLTTGKYSQRFEQELARILGARHCSLVNSGSSANLLALMALTSPKLGENRLRPKDEVITVAAGFPTTIAPILQAGAVPVFVDVRLPDANVDPGLLELALSSRTKTVMLSHTLGFPFDLKWVRQFCDKYNLWLIEDNCDALGSRFCLDGQWHYTGTLGHLGTSSFYPPHHITMGEGGAVYTNDLTLKRIVESLRDWGRDCWCPSGHDNSCQRRFDQQFGTLPPGYDHKYVYSHFGYNLKATDMQAAIGCAQLKKLGQFTRQRKDNHQKLQLGLQDLSAVFHLPQIGPEADPSPFGYLLIVRDTKEGFTRNEITTFLEERNIQTRNLFAGNITRHPCFDHLVLDKDYRIAGELKNTDKIMHDAFWLGVYPGMTGEMIDYMIQVIHEFVKNR